MQKHLEDLLKIPNLSDKSSENNVTMFEISSILDVTSDDVILEIFSLINNNQNKAIYEDVVKSTLFVNQITSRIFIKYLLKSVVLEFDCMMDSTNTTQENITMENDSNFLNYVSQIPIVESTLVKSHIYVDKLREKNIMTRCMVNYVSTCANLACLSATPLMWAFNKPIKMVDHYALNSIKGLEKKFPIIKAPTEEVVTTVKNKIDEKITFGKDKSVKVYHYGNDKLVNVAKYSLVKLDETLEKSKPVKKTVDYILSSADSYISNNTILKDNENDLNDKESKTTSEILSKIMTRIGRRSYTLANLSYMNTYNIYALCRYLLVQAQNVSDMTKNKLTVSSDYVKSIYDRIKSDNSTYNFEIKSELEILRDASQLIEFRIIDICKKILTYTNINIKNAQQVIPSSVFVISQTISGIISNTYESLNEVHSFNAKKVNALGSESVIVNYSKSTYGKNNKSRTKITIGKIDVLRLLRHNSNNEGESAAQLKKNMNLIASKRTIQRDLKKNGRIYQKKVSPRLLKRHKLCRLNFTKKYHIWREDDSLFSSCAHGRGSIMVWGAFGYNGKLNLEINSPCKERNTVVINKIMRSMYLLEELTAKFVDYITAIENNSKEEHISDNTISPDNVIAKIETLTESKFEQEARDEITDFTNMNISTSTEICKEIEIPSLITKT
ncbi:hypothetical protein A3Q56_02380 [Intoshia linei]|uniref:Transposase Tc1-like domain-containing protein n=1 Tax=Intoshia linei TaxID=1819745 RepID=A0A177B817_9BILA|nr:hypothetical protein A3Q56_02380 [Intoshia linei]